MEKDEEDRDDLMHPIIRSLKEEEEEVTTNQRGLLPAGGERSKKVLQTVYYSKEVILD